MGIIVMQKALAGSRKRLTFAVVTETTKAKTFLAKTQRAQRDDLLGDLGDFARKNMHAKTNIFTGNGLGWCHE